MAAQDSPPESTALIAQPSSPPPPSPPSPYSLSSSLFSEFKLFPASCQDRTPSPMGAGLVNLGNTCFVNAVLQCFTHTAPLVQSLRSFHHTAPCGNKGFCVLCSLRDHIEQSLSRSGGIVSPLHLVENLNNLSSSFTAYQQEDAHEFLQCLLDSLHSCCLGSRSQDPPTYMHDDSLVKQIFGGRLRSQLRCCSCSHCSNTFEPLNDLSLEVDDADTLENALRLFTKVEKIEDLEMKFTCDNCNEKVSVEKQLTLDQAPAVTMFHLKRFKSDGYSIEKIKKFVEYPLEIDLQPFLNCSDDESLQGNLKYELYAVVVHIGSFATSGHYFCFIRSSPDSWHKLDDSLVVEVSETTVLSQEAYILFYMRQGLPWFSSLMQIQKKYADSNSATTSPKSVLDDTETRELPFLPGIVNCCSSGSEVGETTGNMDISPPKTPSRISTQDIFYDEPLDNEQEAFYIPRVCSSSAANDGMLSKMAVANVDDIRKAEGLKKLMRGMPSSRRSSLLACIAPSRGSLSEGSLNIRKRRKMVSTGSARSESPPYSDSRSSVSYQSLSPCCLKRAAGQEESQQVLFKIDTL